MWNVLRNPEMWLITNWDEIESKDDAKKENWLNKKDETFELLLEGILSTSFVHCTNE